MSQEYQNISVTEKVSDSLQKLLKRDETGATLSAGTSKPQDIAPWMIGRVFLQTDSKTLSYLSNINPAEWTPILDFSQPLATLSQVQSDYQPLNSNLTALSQLVISADTIPYFNSATSMDVLPVTPFVRSLFECEDESDVQELLVLGDLATVNSITSANVDDCIANSSLPISKFNFTPITKGEGYTIGDVKESYMHYENNEEESTDIANDVTDGFLRLNKNYTIGDSSSGATYRGDTYQNLYFKIWGLPNVTYYTSGGSSTTDKKSSASAAWNAHLRIKLPTGTNYLNSNCIFKIRYK